MLLSTQTQLRLKLTSFTMEHQFSATTRHDSWRERPAYLVIPSSLGFIMAREDVNHVQSNTDGHWIPAKLICVQPATWRNGGEMLPNKSRDEKQRSEAASKKNAMNAIQKLSAFAAYTARLRLGYVCSRRSGTHAPEVTQHSSACLSAPKKWLYLGET